MSHTHGRYDENSDSSFSQPELRASKAQQIPLQPLGVSSRHQTRTRSFVNVPHFQRPRPSALRTYTMQTHVPIPSLKKAHTMSHVESSNVVVLGDLKCGKSTLILTYLNQRLTHPAENLMFETYEKNINFSDSSLVKLQIWDFPGAHEFDRIRPLLYANAKGVFICFDLAKPETFHNVKDRWIPEVEEHCPNAHKILLGLGAGCRLDKDNGGKVPNVDFFQKSLLKLGCKYFECFLSSSRTYSRAFESMALSINGPQKVSLSLSLSEAAVAVGKTRASTMKEAVVDNPIKENDEEGQVRAVRKTSFHKRNHRCSIM